MAEAGANSNEQVPGEVERLRTELAEARRRLAYEAGRHRRAEDLLGKQQRVEEELARSNARLDSIITTAMDAIISVDEQQRVVLFNPAAERMFGVSANEALGTHLNRFVPERFRAAHVHDVARFGETGVSTRSLGRLGTLWGVRADGSEFPVEASIAQALVEGRKLFTVILRDMTQRQRTEDQLRTLAAELRLTLDTAATGLVHNSRDLRYLWANASYGHLVGRPVEEIVGRTLPEVLGASTMDQIRPHIEKVLAGERVEYEAELPFTAGGPRWVHVVYMPERDAAGAVVGWVGSITDVQLRKEAEAALRESEARFRQLAENIPQLAWMTNADGWIFWYNRRWFEYTGRTLAEMQGWGWQAVHHPDYVERVTQRFEAALASGQPWEDTFPLRNHRGEYSWFLSRAFPIRDGQGKVARWFGTNTDISELVAAREALARSRDELEHLVQERTSQLVEANANLQTFTHTAAHDLRSPLRAIGSFSRLLAEECADKLNAEEQMMLGRVVAAADQMNRLLTDLLDYSRMSQAAVTSERVSLGAAVQEALGLLEHDFRGKRAQVQVSAGLPDVLGHQATVVLILSNLLSNALKFARADVPPDVRIRAERAPDPGWVRVWVEDNGIGIAREHWEKVFMAFERLHGKQAYPGTGLGLAIVSKGAQRMGGRAGVESEPGKGSRFWVELKQAPES